MIKEKFAAARVKIFFATCISENKSILGGGGGLKRTKQSVEFERTIKNCDSNMNVRKECKHKELFKKEFIESILPPKKILEDASSNISLKEYHSPFSSRLQTMISIPKEKRLVNG